MTPAEMREVAAWAIHADGALLVCDDGGCEPCRWSARCRYAMLARRRAWLERGNWLRRRGPGYGETPWNPDGRYDP